MMMKKASLLLISTLLIITSCSDRKENKTEHLRLSDGIVYPFKREVSWEFGIKGESPNKIRSFAKEIYRDIFNGSLITYRDKYAGEEISVQELKDENIEALNSEDFLIDSIGEQANEAKDIAGFKLFSRLSFDRQTQKSKMTIESIALYYPLIVKDVDLGRKLVGWIPIDKIKERYSEDYNVKALINSIIKEELQIKKASLQGLQVREVNFGIGSTKGPNVLSHSYLQLSKILYRDALKEKLDVYKTDSLKNVLPLEEREKAGGDEDLVKVLKEPSDPYSMVDSIVFTKYKPERAERYFILEQVVQPTDFTYIFKSKAIAPAYFLTAEGIDIGYLPVFWIKMTDLEQFLSEKEFSWLNRFGHFNLIYELEN